MIKEGTTSCEEGLDGRVQAQGLGIDSGLSSTPTMMPTLLAEPAQAPTSREENRPPPLGLHGKMTSANQPPTGKTIGSLSFATLQPYVPPTPPVFRGRGGVHTRGRGTQQRSQRRTQEFPPLNQSEYNSYKKYFIIKPTNPEIESLWNNHDTIDANDELENALRGAPQRVTELNNGSLLIEVANAQQSQKILQIKKLFQIEVTVIVHQSLNFTKGTIFNKRIANTDDQKLLQKLAKYKVTDLYKIKNRNGNVYENSGLIILTFDSCNLPEEVKIGWMNLEVRKYYPNPRQCYKCQKYNHSAQACRSPVEICSKCAEEGHSGRSCDNPPNCANCDEPHRSNDKKCFFYKLEKEIITVQTNQKVSYKEAKRKTMKAYINPNTTYAVILKNKLSNRIRRDPQIRLANVQETPSAQTQQNNIPKNPEQIVTEQTDENPNSKKRTQSSDSETENPVKKMILNQPLPNSAAQSSSSKPTPPLDRTAANTAAALEPNPMEGTLSISESSKQPLRVEKPLPSDRRGDEYFRAPPPKQDLPRKQNPKLPDSQAKPYQTIPSLGKQDPRDNPHRNRSRSYDKHKK